MRKLIVPAVAALMTAAAAPAFAQTVEQLTVTGQWNGHGEAPATLSRVVDISDLDLTLVSDQQVLRHRVEDTARDICDELGQDRPNHTNLGRSCQENAVRGALDQVHMAVADAYSRPPAYAVTGAGVDTAYVAPAAPEPQASDVTSADTAAAPASYTTTTVTNGPVPDTPENRARYGQPMSHAGKQTAARGN